MNKLTIFTNRLAKTGIDIELVGNFPWVYLDTINGKKVTEIYLANHGFTVMFIPIKLGQTHEFTNIKEIFKLIRKYKNETTKK